MDPPQICPVESQEGGVSPKDPMKADDKAWDQILTILGLDSHGLKGTGAYMEAEAVFLTRCAESAQEARKESIVTLRKCADELESMIGHAESYANCVSCGKSKESEDGVKHYEDCDVLRAKGILERVRGELK